jgi:hypothetical protein
MTEHDPHSSPIKTPKQLIIVVVLALLPTGGDGRDLPGHAELVDRCAQRRIEALRAEEDDCLRATRDHDARTFRVWPTQSSVERSVS